MNSHDWALVHKVKKMITDLPDLAIPPERCYIILETDGCMEGWGGPWVPTKKDLLLLTHIEEALLQIKAKPNMKAPITLRALSPPRTIHRIGLLRT
ncbi:hypothetical protein ZIOFF_048846 [Zingiber officinale]|uniref:Uncharacterized protein n=1 Tax=Zingiber officinale TaxID=94328 RepID=A0A8J5FQB2_ZINOF|nr:hypothetical protein ZIOFF_048846 [Zingiber officinale]